MSMARQTRRQGIQAWQAWRTRMECKALQIELVECMDTVPWLECRDGSLLCLDEERAVALIEEYEELMPVAGDSSLLFPVVPAGW